MGIKADRYENDQNEVTFNVADGADVSRYDVLKLVGEMEVAPTDTSGEDAYGIAVTSAEAGENVGVYIGGLHPATVGSGDGDVGLGVSLTPSGTAGELAPLNDGDATGQDPQSIRPFLTVTSEDDDGLALVDLG